MPRSLGREQIAVCQRSGAKCRAKDLVSDGRIPGLLVLPEWADPPHPQDFIPPLDGQDGAPRWDVSPDQVPSTPPVLSGEVIDDDPEPEPEDFVNLTGHEVIARGHNGSGTQQPGVTVELLGDSLIFFNVFNDAGQVVEVDGDTNGPGVPYVVIGEWWNSVTPPDLDAYEAMLVVNGGAAPTFGDTDTWLPLSSAYWEYTDVIFTQDTQLLAAWQLSIRRADTSEVLDSAVFDIVLTGFEEA